MFEAAGTEAREVLELFWILLAGAAAIWLLLVGATVYAVRWRPSPHLERTGQRLILFGGVVVPAVLLAALTVTSLRFIAELRTAPPDRTIRVTGEQFWWRVQYLDDDGAVMVETANRLVLPKGEVAALELVTADVIHSFWVPALAGKLDMIPGRVNRLVLQPERIGTFRGQCAEFCGESHALMAFDVQVMEPPGFRRWLAAERAPAAEPETPDEQRGSSLFLGYGCGACHSIRGTPARGRIGPDLTHLSARARLAANALRNDRDALLAWLRHPGRIKPGAGMPAFAMLEPDELTAIVTYLASLE